MRSDLRSHYTRAENRGFAHHEFAVIQFCILLSWDHPKSDSWTGWSVRFLGCRARRNDSEWSFHSKELQRSHVPQKTCNPPCSALTKKVNVEFRKKSL